MRGFFTRNGERESTHDETMTVIDDTKKQASSAYDTMTINWVRFEFLPAYCIYRASDEHGSEILQPVL